MRSPARSRSARRLVCVSQAAPPALRGDGTVDVFDAEWDFISALERTRRKLPANLIALRRYQREQNAIETWACPCRPRTADWRLLPGAGICSERSLVGRIRDLSAAVPLIALRPLGGVLEECIVGFGDSPLWWLELPDEAAGPEDAAAGALFACCASPACCH